MAERQQAPTDLETEQKRLAVQSNRNRIEFLRTELQTCFTLIGLAETEQRSGNLEHAARSISDANKAYATVIHFLSDPKHAKHITENERIELNSGLDRVQAHLDK